MLKNTFKITVITDSATILSVLICNVKTTENS